MKGNFMTKFQLWSRDEYGQGSIIDTSDSFEEIVKRAKKEVTDINVNNALTSDDRERNWEAYFVDISTKSKNTKYLYGSQTTLSKNTVYKITSKNITEEKLSDVKNLTIKIYLGNISTNRKEEIDWYAKDNRKNLIGDLNHQDLRDKTFFFVKKI